MTAEQTRIAAAWLCGFVSACNVTKRWPKWVDSGEAQRHAITANQVAFNGGAFNPLNVWEMTDYLKELTQKMEELAKGGK